MIHSTKNGAACGKDDAIVSSKLMLTTFLWTRSTEGQHSVKPGHVREEETGRTYLKLTMKAWRAAAPMQKKTTTSQMRNR